MLRTTGQRTRTVMRTTRVQIARHRVVYGAREGRFDRLVALMARPSKTASVPATALPYFRPEALTFLRNLAKHNDRAWFQPRKAQFEAELREPMLAIVRKITDAMADFAPNHVRPAEKSLFRIYRDTRFSSDKRPYKTHVAAWWTHMGLEKTSGAGYYFHVSAKEVIIAAGSYMPEKEQLAAIRHWLLDHHAEFSKLLKRPNRVQALR